MDPKGASLLPGILPTLEAATRSIRSGDFASGAAVLDRASSLLGTHALDRGDRMILGKVLDRLWKASREADFDVPALRRLGSVLEPR